MTSAGIPYTLPYGHEDNDVSTFWLLLQIVKMTKIRSGSWHEKL